MTILKVYSSPADNDRRSEFTEFYEAAYSTIVGELLALTGSLDHAGAVGAGSFSRAWQAGRRSGCSTSRRCGCGKTP